MIVIADSSPLIVLSKIGKIEILPALFDQVLIPPAVKAELAAGSEGRAARDLALQPPAWLIEKAPSRPQHIAGLDAGELAAINLALELHCEYLLIDDIAGRNAALERHIRITGTVGVLELAASHHLVVLSDAFELLKKTDFWVTHQFLEHRLRLFLQQSRGPS